jgi:L-amino acid N-acyltransferase YncA
METVMLEEYPKKVTLPEGAILTLRPMAQDDQYALYNFFISLPEEDQRFLRNDVADRKIIEKWARNLNYDKVLPILAEYDGKIVPNATLHYQTFGWGLHIAEVRVTISLEFQRRKLGSVMSMEISHLAAKNGVKKVLARVVATRSIVIRALKKVGFEEVTVLKNSVKDIYDQSYADIVLMVQEAQPRRLVRFQEELCVMW